MPTAIASDPKRQATVGVVLKIGKEVRRLHGLGVGETRLT
jgi:hypothetical protein